MQTPSRFIAVGHRGLRMTSTDGTHYTNQNAGLTNDLHGVAWGNGLWVAVGEPGIRPGRKYHPSSKPDKVSTASKNKSGIHQPEWR